MSLPRSMHLLLPILALPASLAAAACGSGTTGPPRTGDIDRIAVSPSSAAVAHIDEEVQFTARAYDAADNEISGAEFAWSVTDAEVAAVEGAGLVRTQSFGSTQVRAEADGVTGTALLTVTGEESLDYLTGTWSVAGTFHGGGAARSASGVAEVVRYAGDRVLVETLRMDVVGGEMAELTSLHAPVGGGGSTNWATVRADGARGSFAVAVGNFALEGEVTFQTGNRFGASERERTVLGAFREGSFTQRIERSDDAGATWSPVWELTWTRDAGAILPAAPTSPSPACAAPPHGAFDYWIGAWDVTSGGAPSGMNDVVGVASGCAVQENWRGLDGSIGVSLNGFDSRRDGWTQVYFDSGGGTLELVGGPEAGVMTLLGQVPGNLDRIQWIPQGDGQIRQLWEKSTDGGTSWSVFFDGLYAPR